MDVSDVATMSIKTSIPPDILHYDIFPWLPCKTISRFKVVCNKWYHLISHDIVFASKKVTMRVTHLLRHGLPILYPMNNLCIRNIIYWNSRTHLLYKDVADSARFPLPPLDEEGIMYHQNIGVARDDQGILTLTRVMSKNIIHEKGEWVKNHTISTTYLLNHAGPGALRIFRAFLSRGGDVLYLETLLATTKRKLLGHNIVTGETTTISELKSSHRHGSCHYIFLNHDSLIRFNSQFS
ncbi:hypothetical protein BHM03_00013328 [Ensete ventricosum]|nr:hypothetical protein BHM03_00013328 [Ensete ventricosum]